MEWTKIDYDGEMLDAVDFLNGVLVALEPPSIPVFVPGYYVQEQRGDMDGPALWPRNDTSKEFELILRQHRGG